MTVLDMMLISHAVGLDQRRAERAITSTPSVDTSAIIIQAGRIVRASGSCASIASAVAESEVISKQNPIRASVVPFVGIRSCGSAAWRQGNEHIPMREPHISTLYGMDDVMSKHFGVTQKQALRTQALLRLGVTEEDVKIAERLLASRFVGDNVSDGRLELADLPLGCERETLFNFECASYLNFFFFPWLYLNYSFCRTIVVKESFSTNERISARRRVVNDVGPSAPIPVRLCLQRCTIRQPLLSSLELLV